MKETILVIDDEKDVLRLVEYNLLEEGFRVMTAMTGKDALALMSEHRPNLILLDLILPDMDGFDLCKSLKKNPESEHIPVIILSAKARDVDRVVGFELGCDEYIVKPFNHRELVLRVRAILRRMNPPIDTSGIIQVADMMIDTINHQLSIGSRPIELTPTEFKLIVFLVRRKGQIQSRDTLLRQVWGQDPEEVDIRTVDTHVRRLRQKMGHLEYLIRTRRKPRMGEDKPYGYIFRAPMEGIRTLAQIQEEEEEELQAPEEILEEKSPTEILPPITPSM
jgi:two-component system phosphate regulon response regulator PhoB